MAIVTVGIDPAKSVFAVHGIDEGGKPVVVRPEVPRGNRSCPTGAPLKEGLGFTAKHDQLWASQGFKDLPLLSGEHPGRNEHDSIGLLDEIGRRELVDMDDFAPRHLQ